MLKIAVIDDHQLVRTGLNMLISSFENIEVVLEADNGKELLERLITVTVDVIV